jgi:hypothetical protein
MKIKKFDQALHDKYDPPARKAVIDWIQMKWGLQAIDNPNIYGTDLIIYRAGKQVGWAEVEVRQWSPVCPFYTIHVPVRKKEMLEVPNTLFFALTQDMKNAYWIKGHEVLSYPQIEMKDNTKHEFYYDVPKHLFKYIDLTQLF